jgi:hypothetical protein
MFAAPRVGADLARRLRVVGPLEAQFDPEGACSQIHRQWLFHPPNLRYHDARARAYGDARRGDSLRSGIAGGPARGNAERAQRGDE